MGKKDKTNGAGKLHATNGQKIRPVSSYFPYRKGEGEDGPGRQDSLTMADTQIEIEAESPALTKDDLKLLETRLITKIAALMSPIQQKLDALSTALTETKQTADYALELASSAQGETKAQQLEQKVLKHKLLTVEMEAKAYNVKIRGIKEQAECNKDLQTFVANWLAQELKIEEGIVPTLTEAYRIGAPVNPKRLGPRDILVTFANMRDKIKIMREAKKRGHLLHEGENVELFQDLPIDVIALRRELRPVTQQLSRANMHYQWIGPAKLQTMHNGKLLQATNLETGTALLRSMGLFPPEEQRKTAKRKLEVNTTPTKGSKIPVKARS